MRTRCSSDRASRCGMQGHTCVRQLQWFVPLPTAGWHVLWPRRHGSIKIDGHFMMIDAVSETYGASAGWLKPGAPLRANTSHSRPPQLACDSAVVGTSTLSPIAAASCQQQRHSLRRPCFEALWPSTTKRIGLMCRIRASRSAYAACAGSRGPGQRTWPGWRTPPAAACIHPCGASQGQEGREGERMQVAGLHPVHCIVSAAGGLCSAICRPSQRPFAGSPRGVALA